MRMREAWATRLWTIALGVAPGLASGCLICDEDRQDLGKRATFEVRSDGDGRVDQLLAACELDERTCVDLCAYLATELEGSAVGTEDVLACEVRDQQPATIVQVT